MKKEPPKPDLGRVENASSDNEHSHEKADQKACVRDKKHLMENMAYQIRTLSNAVIGFSELLLSEDLTPDQMDYVREIDEAGQGLSTLVSEVLDGLGNPTLPAHISPHEDPSLSLRIPVGADPATPIKSKTVQSDWEQTHDSNEAILLVEDQQSNRTVITLMLESLGMTVETAVDGEDALRKVEQNSYSLILMDLKMPNMDGYEATGHLRKQGIEIPVVAISAKVLDNDEQHRISEMFDEFLTKPVCGQKLAGILQRFIKGFSTANESSEQEALALEYGN